MKKLFLFLLLTALMMTDLYGQLKQRKVLLQQIAALKVYTDYAQKGYSEAKKGLTTIGDFKGGRDYSCSTKNHQKFKFHY